MIKISGLKSVYLGCLITVLTMESQAEALNELSADELDGKAWLILPKIEKKMSKLFI